ncbi:uncharacterized protein LOC122619574 [Drosophila teissieri]|uniref:uncharacterized protein LOC122619574 n=1 Tax=Drosophila teissieri TaxID=7243 RepID=UPI001CBA52D1|nr:uncharacterized protein LOC122619574 [Drosophila teissieri]
MVWFGLEIEMAPGGWRLPADWKAWRAVGEGPTAGSGGTGRDPRLHFAVCLAFCSLLFYLQAKLFNHRQLYFGSRCDLSHFEVTSASEKTKLLAPPSDPHPVRRKTKQCVG